MEKSSVKCSIPTNADSKWPYQQQYYFGDKDQEQRRNGRGENHWSGAESLEWYTGKFVRDTMHGEGEYRWRYKEPEGTFYTYEGRFYGNRMHGYGVMSYPDGRVFNGIFYNNMRWGPGIESNTSLRENVGLWRCNQLVRLTWRPNAPSVTLDFNFEPAAKSVVEAHRTLLATSVRNIGEVNSAIELLKQCGAAPIVASEKWIKLYPTHCNDLVSQVCHVELFDHEYYKNSLVQLDEIKKMPISNEETPNNITDDDSNYEIYYAWNNSDTMVSMMKHCFTHETQRKSSGVDLATILSVRTNYKRAGKHEFDCRNLIMCSYLGHTSKVAELINKDNVHPDVADMLGNTALMYATCGNQVDIVHFLAEAGANVNNFNDSCCTPLSVALLRFACLSKDIPAAGMVQTFSPPPQPVAKVPPQQYTTQKPSEWHITRQMPVPGDSVQTNKLASKTKLAAGHKAIKSNTTIDVLDPNEKRRTLNEIKSRKSNGPEQITIEADVVKTPEETLFNEINQEFLQHVTNWFSIPGAPNPAYLFDVSDMVKEIDGSQDDRIPPKPRRVSTNKDVVKTSQHVITRLDSTRDDFSISSAEREKILLLNKSMSTIVQLLSDGADPLLARCPQPALFSAVVSGSLNLVRQLVHYGADINEVYPDVLNYTAVDVAFSRPPTYDNLALVRTILECGGTVDHRLKCESDNEEIPGPTLLHAVLVRLNDDITEEKICCELLQSLLEYGCKPLERYRGVSAIDMVMEKNLKIFDDVFVKSPKIDLNATINDNNQTMLVKMLSIEFYKNNPITERLQTLTTLLLYGADPLLECDNRDMKYANIFVFANKTIFDIELKLSTETRKTIVAAPKKVDPKKAKKEETKTKTPARSVAEDMEDYRQALYLVRDSARLQHIRWIQAKLMRELMGVVEKFEHRHWTFILPEHKNKIPCGLWLSMSRCLEIWDIFKANKKRECNDRRILKHILCLVHFYCNRAKTTLKWPLTAEERGTIETNATLILKDHKKLTEKETGSSLGKPYVTPELFVRAEEKFQICFECALPLPEDKILCKFCKQISYCSLDCMKRNLKEQSVGIHPCCQNLVYEYFPSPANSSTVTR